MILAARLALNFAMAAFSDPVDPNAKFKLKFVACPSIAPRTITSAMGPVAQGPFSTSSEAPATILGSAGPSCSIYELREQRDLTNADPSFSWSSCTHAASAAQ